MPIYHYQCPDEHLTERLCSIEEMLEFESALRNCEACAQTLIRLLRPGQRTVRFHEGFYEHLSADGAYISSMSDLKRIAKENGNYSRYAEDLGGLWRAKEGRWI